ncbi:MAG: DNA-directed RNA polymerase subunit omega [Tissierellia bacterium]|nr:DNA-directed RNA polymerase subunit omega [Tissierellia bacterium]
MYIRSFDDIKKVADSRYSLTMLISKRAREIVEESATLTEYENENPVSIAYKEIMEGEIGFAKNKNSNLKLTDISLELTNESETLERDTKPQTEIIADEEDEQSKE